MKILQILSVMAFATCMMMSCNTAQKQNTTSQDDTLPELLMRPQVIGPEEEMGYILDSYNSLVAKIKSNPKDADARLSLAELMMQEARISGEHGHYYPAALKLINGVMTDDLNEALRYRALMNKASVLLSLHQFAEAKTTGEQALALNAHSADAYGVLVDANVELGDYEKAVMMADKMVSIRPDLRSYSRVSYLREIYGEIDGAIDAMKLAVAAGYPGMEQTEWSRLTLGHLYERYGSQDSAMMQYGMALSARPNYPFAIAALANTYEAMGDTKTADSLNTVACNLIPEVGFYVDKATWALERGDKATSDKLSNEILAMMADDEAAGHSMSIELSKVYLHLRNDDQKALEYAMKEYAIRPNNIDVNRLLAEIYYHQGNLEKSKEHLTASLRTGSKDPAAMCLEGLLMTRTNQPEEGQKMLRQVFVDNPNLDCSYCKEAKSIII